MTDRRLGLALFAAEGLAALLDLTLAPRGPWSPEELRNAQGGALIACGHLADWTELQYRPFCGGCTATSLLAAPVFRGLGASLEAWKAVPLAFHLVTTALLLGLGHRLGGRRGLWAAGLLLLAAPEAWRDLAATGWGNHVESAVFTLGALALAGTEAPKRAGAIGLSAAAGLVAGLGLWFCATSAHGLPGILFAAALTHRAAALGALPALALGVAPALLYRSLHPVPAGADALPLTTLQWAPLGAQLRWWLLDFTEGTLWRALPQGELDPVGLLAWVLLLGGGLGGLVIGGRAGRPFLLAALGLFGATALRYDLWADSPALRGFEAFHFRYRAPLLPLLWLGLAALVARRPRVGAGVVGMLVIIGLPLRILAIGDETPAWRQATFEPLLPDPTVPSGLPRQRLDRLLHRPQDIEAARRFAFDHTDALPICRAGHLGELGRRVGLAIRQRGAPVLAATLPAEFPSEADRAALVAGIRLGLGDADPALERAIEGAAPGLVFPAP